MKFTEAKLEQTFTELLGNEGFPHHLGITIKQPPNEVLIEEGLTLNEVKIILQLKSLAASDLYDSNKKFIRIYKN